MSDLEIGFVLPLYESPPDARIKQWDELRAMALLAEEIGFDTVWVPDELLWRVSVWPGSRGWWECVAMAGAIAASTERIKVGTWVLSANQRNPGLTERVVETLDEISGGRFIFGLGSGSGDREAEAFGLPRDHVVGRFEDALEIIVPMLREGRAEHDGPYHRAVDLESRPRGPRPGAIPLMIGAGGPRTIGLAARHADIWSWYVNERSDPAEFEPLVQALEAACAEIGRDPATIGRSVGVFIEPTDVTGSEEYGLGVPVRGRPEEIAAAIEAFGDVGITQVECMIWPDTLAALEAMRPVVERLREGRGDQGAG
jgi:alkanesulfonate monooxygenase SsuD/methylene tetrahydromethanopterin reductase-like flavin-dependent oxidoreductase (luciferase family)